VPGEIIAKHMTVPNGVALPDVPDLCVDRNFDARCPVRDTAHHGCIHTGSTLREKIPHSLADRVRMRPQPRQLLT